MRRIIDFIITNLSDMIATVRRSQTLLLIVLAILVGLGGGIGVWLFKLIYNLLQTFMFQTAGGWLAPFGKWTLALIPVIGGLAVGLFNHYFLKEEKVHGTAAVMQSVALSGGRLPYQSAPAKAAAAALSLGSGASVGPEDPAVQIGANIASMFGQWLRLSDERVKILVAAGAGSAIAAAFNAADCRRLLCPRTYSRRNQRECALVDSRFNGCFLCLHASRFRKCTRLSSASLSISFSMGIAFISFAGIGCRADLRVICRPAL